MDSSFDKVAVSFCPKKKHGMNSIKNNGGNTMTEAVHAMLWTMAAAFLKERIRIEKSCNKTIDKFARRCYFISTSCNN
jgi:hypothetical protein